MSEEKIEIKERLRQILEQEADEPMCEDQDEVPAYPQGVTIGDIKGNNISVTINCAVAPGSIAGGPGGGIWRSLHTQLARRFGASRVRNDHLETSRLPTPPETPTGWRTAQILEFRPPRGA